jgi:hypothetical protein
VHHQLAQSWPPSTFLLLLYLSLQVYLEIHLIMAFKYIFKEQQQVYGDPGITEVDRVMESIYSSDPGVYRHYFISISSYHTITIHTISFPTFGLTRSV